MSEGDEHVRIGTPEREEALALLNMGFSEGRLNPAEFSKRCAAVGAAVNRGQLQAVLADLPGGVAAVARQESLDEAVERRLAEANRIDVASANSQATNQQVMISAADDLAARLMELAQYLNSRIPPRTYEVGVRPKHPSFLERMKPLAKSPPSFKLDNRTNKWEQCYLVPDGRLWQPSASGFSSRPAGYVDLRECFSRHGGLTIDGYQFHPDYVSGVLAASSGGHDEVPTRYDPKDALASIAAAVLRREAVR